MATISHRSHFACFYVYRNGYTYVFAVFRYVWQNLDIGYVQGMCDLFVPLLVVLDDGEGV